MEQTVSPARKIVGEAVVPGEREPAAQALVLAALAEGESRIHNAPPAIAPLVQVLGKLGVGIALQQDGLVVRGCGLRGFRAPDGALELDGLGDTDLLVLGLLAGQDFATPVKADEGRERCGKLLELLAPMGVSTVRESGEILVVGGVELTGIAHREVEMDAALKLAICIAGLCARGHTTLLEPAKHRDQVVRLLRQRQIEVERHKQEGSDHYLVSVEGRQNLEPCAMEIPGDVRLAYPLVAAALALKGSVLSIRRVAIHPGKRALLDTLRHMGAPITLEEDGDGTSCLQVRSGVLKSTRIAGQRTEKLLDQVALLAVLATQARGEFIIRDLGRGRRTDFDYAAHLVALLRQIEAKVGEFPEGFIIEGGHPLQGGRIDSKGDAGLVMAFAVAGLLAENEMEITEAECLDQVYPDFFETLEALKEKRR